MNARDVLQKVTALGGRLIVNGDRLIMEAPAPLPEDIRDAVRQCKAELTRLLTPSAAGHVYCPGCRSHALTHQDDQTTCSTCGAWWFPRIDLNHHAPNATIRVRHPDGHTVLIAMYRCPQCKETRWGPRIDNPDLWYCLTCCSSMESGA